MDITTFISKLKESPTLVTFEDTMLVIEKNYTFVPTTFHNGQLTNEAGQNAGSCKVLAFAQEHSLTVDETLQCFGDYYRKDVLGNPEGRDHQNIRNFMQHGWNGIRFESVALVKS
ncbi:HopJ type III effector protein [Reichenbachiella agarivorans]|uniref:HopJ type III effector protein n=1 Tax=Reichenbachiella agarivorans TaxID=2979464 RepID=A0ABY6CM44_9BACT|nr:HopJ type III effector protein [Reichenbachiella agarivorans]UXP31576.1 HopJ type III effector protein [Reichenbachiella agarivorans]